MPGNNATAASTPEGEKMDAKVSMKMDAKVA